MTWLLLTCLHQLQQVRDRLIAQLHEATAAAARLHTPASVQLLQPRQQQQQQAVCRRPGCLLGRTSL